MTQPEQSGRDVLPTAVGLCPRPSHAVEFYLPLESAASVVQCPEPGCHEQLVDDVGPLVKRPDIVGICAEHGWWFEMRREEESCPESGCLARVHVYHWTHHYAPSRGDD